MLSLRSSGRDRNDTGKVEEVPGGVLEGELAASGLSQRELLCPRGVWIPSAAYLLLIRAESLADDVLEPSWPRCEAGVISEARITSQSGLSLSQICVS